MDTFLLREPGDSGLDIDQQSNSPVPLASVRGAAAAWGHLVSKAHLDPTRGAIFIWSVCCRSAGHGERHSGHSERFPLLAPLAAPQQSAQAANSICYHKLHSCPWCPFQGRVGAKGEGLLVCLQRVPQGLAVGRAWGCRDKRERQQSRGRRKAGIKYSWFRDVIHFHLNILNPPKPLTRGGLWLPNSQSDKLPK